MYSIPSAHGLQPRPPCTYSGRAGNACTNLLGFLVRYVRTRGMVKIAESARLSDFTLLFAARTCHAWLARLTRARGVSSQREGNALFADFWYFSSLKSTIKEKLLYDFSLSEFFSLVRKERKGQKEECFDSRLGDAVQRWLRHPEPSSWSRKSTIREKLL